jgi:signal transduction histidine kinase
MIGPDDVDDHNKLLVKMFVSGYGERLGRHIILFEPELDGQGEPTEEPDPNRLGKTRPKLRRIEQLNLRRNFTEYCNTVRGIGELDEACIQCDKEFALQVFQAARDDPARLEDFAQGYPCHMNLIDQAAVIRYHQTPVAVVLSGQFRPNDDASLEQVYMRIEELRGRGIITDQQKEDWPELVMKLETRDQYIDSYMRETEMPDPTSPKRPRPTMSELFLRVGREFEQVATAQFQMYKRDQESKFLHDLRQEFPSSPAHDRESIAGNMTLMLEEVLRFCGARYLALFISPQRYISYEGNSNLLPLFMQSGIEDDVINGISYFNWRRSHLKLTDETGLNETDPTELDHQPHKSFFVSSHKKAHIILKNSIKGEKAYYFKDAALLCQMRLSEAYQAALVWGPFMHLQPQDLEKEEHFLEEISELVMMRILSSAQLSDSDNRTSAWEDVANLLNHNSRRAMNPVSTGVRIISDYLKGGKIYSRADAETACDSLETASRVISQAVRSTLASFAATSEKVYEFKFASLEKIVRDCIVLYQPMAFDKAITFRVDPNIAALPEIEMDVAKMETAIGNVLENAIKYSHRNKEIRIHGKRSDSDYVRLTIEDFGQGIKEEELKLVFAREYQGERSKKAMYEEGEGLGLFHTRLIVDAHKGEIWCRCQSGTRTEDSRKLEGYRVRFTFELPIMQSDAQNGPD